MGQPCDQDLSPLPVVIGFCLLVIGFCVGFVKCLHDDQAAREQQRQDLYKQEAAQYDWVITDGAGNTYVSDGAPYAQTYKEMVCIFTDKQTGHRITIGGPFRVERVKDGQSPLH